MRSLAVKLTLAFLLVGVTGAILVAVLVGQRTRREFDRFVAGRDQTITIVVDALHEYYSTNGSWAGVGRAFADRPAPEVERRDIVLVDANRVVRIGNRRYPPRQRVPLAALNASTPIEVDGATVGYVLLDPGGLGRLPPELDFLRRVTLASAISAVVAAVIALIVGSLIALTLTRPLRDLTAATQAMARGDLGQQVTVRSRDEIGELADSFNQMSSDLARASQMRKQMTADIAHDLRTPLSIVRGYTEGLKDGRLQGSAQLYAIMHDEVEHLQHLVEDLRMLSLADAGELSLQRRVVDPAALLERTGLAYVVQAEEQGIRLRVEASANLPSIAVDTERMTQVLNNLVSNALRHTLAGEIVLAAAPADDQHVALQVRDTGRGIAPDDLPFIFDRFYRVDKSRQRGDGISSGLGLAIAKAIVEAHNGTIAVASTPAHGTTFTIILPMADQEMGVLSFEC